MEREKQGHYALFVSNLRRVGCPEETITTIIRADLLANCAMDSARIESVIQKALTRPGQLASQAKDMVDEILYNTLKLKRVADDAALFSPEQEERIAEAYLTFPKTLGAPGAGPLDSNRSNRLARAQYLAQYLSSRVWVGRTSDSTLSPRQQASTPSECALTVPWHSVDGQSDGLKFFWPNQVDILMVISGGIPPCPASFATFPHFPVAAETAPVPVSPRPRVPVSPHFSRIKCQGCGPSLTLMMAFVEATRWPSTFRNQSARSAFS